MINKILDRLFVVTGALLFIQIPFFIQQYLTQLRGHVDELQLQVSALQNHATSTGKTLQQYIHKFVVNSDPDIAHQGEWLNALTLRLQQLSNSLFALDHSTVWSKPYQFLTHLHYDILESTFQHYEFGIAFTLESLTYGLFGMLFGYFLFAAMKKLLRTGEQKQKPMTKKT